VLGQPASESEDHLEFRLLGLDSARTVTLARRLSATLGLEVSATALFDHCSVAALGAHLSERLAPPPEVEPALAAIPAGRLEARGADIAVIGMAGRFPQAATLAQLWSNLAAGRDAVSEIPADRWAVDGFYDAEASRPDRSISKWGCFLSGVREFDPLFFGISPADAALMDPQHRIGLEEAWKAFEDAGYAPEALEGRPVGVFAGLRRGDFESLLDRRAAPPSRAALLGNDPSMLASRLAFRMNLTGPSLTVDTACSSSLAAVHLACQSLVAGECDMALAGGVCLVLSPDFYVATSKLGIFSPTGRCRAFDREADGFVQGEGAGFVVLKRLSDALRDGDSIHAVIKGTALNQDGRTNGIGAPSPRSQAAVQERVYRQFGIDPRTITYVEAHGTGTQLGDSIEIDALTRSFRAYSADRGFCAIGSIKTNIGHLTAAAGIAGLIKAILCLQHRQIPPSLGFEQQNPSLRFEETPFYVNDRLRPWEAMPGWPRRAAVNSFGLSGTNVHCVVEEAPVRPEPARRISLPTYPFERQTCWPPPELLRSADRDPIELQEGSQRPESSPPGTGDLRQLLRGVLGALLDVEPSALDPEADLDSYGYDSIVAVDLKATLERTLQREVPIGLLAGGMSLNRLADRLQEQPRPGDPSAPFPLTAVQAAYFFGKAAAVDGVGCHTYLEFEVESLDPGRLTQAWNRLVLHHPMLRAQVRATGDQRILDEAPGYDIAACEVDGGALEQHLAAVRGALSHRLYEPGAWPLFEIRATLVPGRKAVVHVSMDNWIVDGVSAEILYETWHQLYHAPATALAPLDFTFRDYGSHLRSLLASEAGKRQLDYWRRKLSACPEGPALPYIEPVPGAPAQFRRHRATIEAGVWSALKKRAAEMAVFPTGLVLAAFVQTLAATSGEERFAVVLTHSHRRRFHPQVEQVVGPFTSTSVAIAEGVKGAPLAELAVRLNQQLGDDLLHRDVCATGALAALARETGRIPSLPVVFTARLGAGQSPQRRRPSWLDDLSFLVSQTPGVALENRVGEVDGRLEIAWDVAASRLGAACVEAMLGDFQSRLRQAAYGDAARAAGEPEELPLTALQQVYLAERVRADQGRWAEATVYQEIDVGELDVERFKQALRRLSELEPAIGGTITERGTLRPRERSRIPRVDVEDLRLGGREAAAARRDQIRRSMLAARGPEGWAPSIRARVTIDGGATRVHLATDMTLADGFSVLLLYVRLLELCREPARSRPAGAVSFVDHLARQHRERASPGGDEDLAYWLQKIEQAPPGPALPRPPARRDDRLPVSRLGAELEVWEALRA
ncbi:MAG: beta-ketoacyl synthase N-terminal-like domain-containing protein, partial [Thermoanaerobaculia bacterium]